MSVELDLPNIIARAQAGDTGAISDLYTTYAGHVLRYLYARLSEQETAKDLTQEVFIRVMKGIGTFEYRGDKSFLGWIYTIANNVLIGHVRRAKLLHTPLDESLELADPRSQEGVGAVHDRVALTQAMQRLTPDQQQVLALRFYADMSNAEIARQLKRTEGSVKALQFRALQALQQIMAQEQEEQPVIEKPAPSQSQDYKRNGHLEAASLGPLQRMVNGAVHTVSLEVAEDH
jgi:RNA polymerase sigma-70 factor (ECF subfamily)